jgi:hypothetical protein
MHEDNPRNEVSVRRTGGCYSLVRAFALLDISPSFGHALIKAGKIRVIRLGPGSPRITDQEIERLLTEGISSSPPAAPGRARGAAAQRTAA